MPSASFAPWRATAQPNRVLAQQGQYVCGDDAFGVLVLVAGHADDYGDVLQRARPEYSSCSTGCVGTVSPTREDGYLVVELFLRQVQSGNDSEAGG